MNLVGDRNLKTRVPMVEPAFLYKLVIDVASDRLSKCRSDSRAEEKTLLAGTQEWPLDWRAQV